MRPISLYSKGAKGVGPFYVMHMLHSRRTTHHHTFRRMLGPQLLSLSQQKHMRDAVHRVAG